jgi:hypothetical protein
MNQTRSRSTPPQMFVQGVVQHVGEVERDDAPHLVVSTPQGIRRARVALSCLVRPVCGDTVLVADHDDALYVLAVLERSSGQPIAMAFDRDTEITVTGTLAVQAETRMALQAPGIELATQELSVVARTARFVADTLEATARLIRQWSESWSVRSKSHDRQTDDLELVRAGHIDLKVDHVAQLRATHTIVKSTELTKIDGRQIQVG